MTRLSGPQGFLVPFLLLAVCGAALAVTGWIYQVDKGKCIGCGFCVYWCPSGAISMQGADAYIDPLLCNGCGECVSHCPWGAIYRVWWEGVESPAGDTDATLSPNPSPGILTVSGLPDGMRVSALDASGREIATSTVTGGSADLDLTGSCSGVVFVLAGDRFLGTASILEP